MKQANLGFSLVELLVVVAIIGILSGFALPLYSNYVERGYRHDVREDIVAISAAISQYKMKYINRDYTDVNDYPGVKTAISNASTADYYSINVNVAADGDTFLIIAKPKGGTKMEGNGALLFDHTNYGCWYEDDDSQDSLNASCDPDNAF